MSPIIGIGGVFLLSAQPSQLAAWYSHHLGFVFEQMEDAEGQITYYQELYYRDLTNPQRTLHTVFAIMPHTATALPPRPQLMINYQVTAIDDLVAQFHAAGIPTTPIQTQRDAEGWGKFARLHDPEGNPIELWQHLD